MSFTFKVQFEHWRPFFLQMVKGIIGDICVKKFKHGPVFQEEMSFIFKV